MFLEAFANFHGKLPKEVRNFQLEVRNIPKELSKYSLDHLQIFLEIWNVFQFCNLIN